MIRSYCLGQGQVQAVFAVVRDVDAEAVLAEPLFQVVGGLLLVFDDQDAHPTPTAPHALADAVLSARPARLFSEKEN
jgi:hypothetical protein